LRSSCATPAAIRPKPSSARRSLTSCWSEIWAVRLEHDVLTGVFGPIACTPSAAVLPELPYEDHPDDLEWVIRSVEDFRVVDGPVSRAA
jgi:hypothetical protein